MPRGPRQQNAEIGKKCDGGMIFDDARPIHCSRRGVNF